jgi:GT2 family glycosyltransferase
MNLCKVSVVIPTYNRKKLLEKLLLQIREQGTINSVVSVWIVNDGSSDGTGEMLDISFPEVNVITGNGNWWYTRCINEGISAALQTNPDNILLLNDDIDLDGSYFDRLLDDWGKQKQPAILGSISYTCELPHRLTFSGVKRVRWWRAKQHFYHPFLTESQPGSLSGIFPSVVLPGRGMLISAQLIKMIGKFEEQLPQYGSDDEFCLRARKAGFPVNISWNAIIYSHHRLTGAGTPYLKQSFPEFLKSFFNKHSRNYLLKHHIIYTRYGIKALFPLTLIIILLGDLKAYFSHKLQ